MPAYGHLQRVDAALNKGAGQLVDTIQQGLGIPIDHYVELNFDGFQNVINALGGINMYFPAPLRDAYSSLNITRTGCQHLDGFQALAVVRARHLRYYADGRWQSDPLSDLSRIRRDHEFLKVLFTAVKTKGLSNPVTANTVLGKLVGQIKLDSSFSFTTLVNLATRYSAVNPNTVPVTTLPISVATACTYRGANYGDIDLPVEPDDQATITQFLGTPPTMTGPAGVTVDVADTSHIPGQAHQIATALQARGYTITIPTISADPVDAHPAETVISYPPGSLPAAQKLKADLAGPVMLGQDSHLPAGTLHLAVGPNLTTPHIPAAQHGTAAPTAEATNSPRGPVTSPNDQLASFDPTACPGQP